MRRRLRENGYEVGRSVVVDDGLHVGRLIKVVSDGPLQFSVTVRDADQGHEVSTGRRAGNANSPGIEAVQGLITPKEANRRFAVVNLRRKHRFGRKSIIDAGNRVACLHKFL